MRCKACRNNGDIADNSSSYVKESGCTNYTLKSVKGHADSKQHRKVEDRIRNKARPLYRIASSDATVNNKPEDAERALSMLTTSVAARVNLRSATLTPSRRMSARTRTLLGWPLALKKIAVNDFT